MDGDGNLKFLIKNDFTKLAFELPPVGPHSLQLLEQPMEHDRILSQAIDRRLKSQSHITSELKLKLFG